jgi:hypothetical protein
VRAVLLIVLAAWLSLAGVVFAQGDSDSQSPDESNHEQSAPTAEDQAPAGPTLQPVDNAPVVCDPAYPGFRYLEVRGTGFDAWATQRLVGSFVDSTGVPQAQWSSVWVSPQGP